MVNVERSPTSGRIRAPVLTPIPGIEPLPDLGERMRLVDPIARTELWPVEGERDRRPCASAGHGEVLRAEGVDQGLVEFLVGAWGLRFDSRGELTSVSAAHAPVATEAAAECVNRTPIRLLILVTPPARWSSNPTMTCKLAKASSPSPTRRSA